MSHKPFITVGELMALLSHRPLDAKIAVFRSTGMPPGTVDDVIPPVSMWTDSDTGRQTWGVSRIMHPPIVRVMSGKIDRANVHHDDRPDDDVIILLSSN